MKFTLKLTILMLVTSFAGAAEPTWTRLTDEQGEGQPFTLPAAAKVRYGAQSAWIEKDLLAGTYFCRNEFFGSDPLYGVPKACWVLSGPARTNAPLCFPDPAVKLKVKTIQVDPAQFGGDDNFSVWACEKPDGRGYKNEAWLWSYSKVANHLIAASVGLFNEAAAREHCSTNCVAPTAEVQARAAPLTAPFLAVATVTANAASPAATRPVYGLNADGTRNTTAIPNARIGANQPCDIGDRLPGTSYYSVAGRPNTAVAGSYPPLGASIYALCTFKAPVGVNK
jgi:hypothetical protein